MKKSTNEKEVQNGESAVLHDKDFLSSRLSVSISCDPIPEESKSTLSDLETGSADSSTIENLFQTACNGINSQNTSQTKLRESENLQENYFTETSPPKKTVQKLADIKLENSCCKDQSSGHVFPKQWKSLDLKNKTSLSSEKHSNKINEITSKPFHRGNSLPHINIKVVRNYNHVDSSLDSKCQESYNESGGTTSLSMETKSVLTSSSNLSKQHNVLKLPSDQPLPKVVADKPKTGSVSTEMSDFDIDPIGDDMSSSSSSFHIGIGNTEEKTSPRVRSPEKLPGLLTTDQKNVPKRRRVQDIEGSFKLQRKVNRSYTQEYPHLNIKSTSFLNRSASITDPATEKRFKMRRPQNLKQNLYPASVAKDDSKDANRQTHLPLRHPCGRKTKKGRPPAIKSPPAGALHISKMELKGVRSSLSKKRRNRKAISKDSSDQTCFRKSLDSWGYTSGRSSFDGCAWDHCIRLHKIPDEKGQGNMPSGSAGHSDDSVSSSRRKRSPNNYKKYRQHIQTPPNSLTIDNTGSPWSEVTAFFANSLSVPKPLVKTMTKKKMPTPLGLSPDRILTPCSSDGQQNSRQVESKMVEESGNVKSKGRASRTRRRKKTIPPNRTGQSLNQQKYGNGKLTTLTSRASTTGKQSRNGDAIGIRPEQRRQRREQSLSSKREISRIRLWNEHMLSKELAEKSVLQRKKKGSPGPLDHRAHLIRKQSPKNNVLSQATQTILNKTGRKQVKRSKLQKTRTSWMNTVRPVQYAESKWPNPTKAVAQCNDQMKGNHSSSETVGILNKGDRNQVTISKHPKNTNREISKVHSAPYGVNKQAFRTKGGNCVLCYSQWTVLSESRLPKVSVLPLATTVSSKEVTRWPKKFASFNTLCKQRRKKITFMPRPQKRQLRHPPNRDEKAEESFTLFKAKPRPVVAGKGQLKPKGSYGMLNRSGPCRSTEDKEIVLLQRNDFVEFAICTDENSHQSPAEKPVDEEKSKPLTPAPTKSSSVRSLATSSTVADVNEAAISWHTSFHSLMDLTTDESSTDISTSISCQSTASTRPVYQTSPSTTSHRKLPNRRVRRMRYLQERMNMIFGLHVFIADSAWNLVMDALKYHFQPFFRPKISPERQKKVIIVKKRVWMDRIPYFICLVLLIMSASFAYLVMKATIPLP